MGSLHVLRVPAGRFWSHLRLPQIGDAPQGETLACDVTLFDEAGVLATITGLRLLRTSEAALRRLVGRGGPDDITRWFQTVTWETLPAPPEKPEQTGQMSAPDTGEWLIFAGEDAAGAALAQTLRGRGLRAHVVKAGAAFAEPHAGASADESVWTIAAREAGDYRRLLHEVLGGGTGARPLAGVLYLWGLDLPPAGDGDLLQAQEGSLGGALYLAQALAAEGQPAGGRAG